MKQICDAVNWQNHQRKAKPCDWKTETIKAPAGRNPHHDTAQSWLCGNGANTVRWATPIVIEYKAISLNLIEDKKNESMVF